LQTKGRAFCPAFFMAVREERKSFFFEKRSKNFVNLGRADFSATSPV
jgi:hypothetical protein